MNRTYKYVFPVIIAVLAAVLVDQYLSFNQVYKCKDCTICRKQFHNTKWLTDIGVVRDTTVSNNTECSSWVDLQKEMKHDHNIVPRPDVHIWNPFSSLTGSSTESSSINVISQQEQLAIYKKCATREARHAAMEFFGKFKRHTSLDLNQRQLESGMLMVVDALARKDSLNEVDFTLP